MHAFYLFIYIDTYLCTSKHEQTRSIAQRIFLQFIFLFNMQLVIKVSLTEKKRYAF